MRPFLALSHDVIMAVLSFGLSVYLYLGSEVLAIPIKIWIIEFSAFALISVVIFWSMGLYRGIWRYASMNDLEAIFKAVCLVIPIFALSMFLINRLEFLPRASLFINWFILILMLGGPRFLYRILKDGSDRNLLRSERVDCEPVLLFGTNDTAERFIREMGRDQNSAYRVVGIIDDNPHQISRRIHDVPVLGLPETLPEIMTQLRKRSIPPQRLVVAKPDLLPENMSTLVMSAQAEGLQIARLPRATELQFDASNQMSPRPVAIEDLLGRPQTELNLETIRLLIAKKRILVTGAGGTIGGELTRQIAALAPSRLVMVDSSEFQLFEIDCELNEKYPALDRVAYLADIRDQARITDIIADEKPALLFHAAALKHVPMVENNPIEGVLTNVVGTRIVADAARAQGVEILVLISTDKAVNPSNVMGASKRVAEAYCQALDLSESDQHGIDQEIQKTRFVTVRFGNVLGSTGSVVPLFRRQLARGGPLTVTHPDMERYFMTVDEAVALVLQASALRQQSHATALSKMQPLGLQIAPGGIFVLDMGKPVKILDLARQMIRLSGLRPNNDVQIVYTGLRPGEKLSEELFHAAEQLVPTTNSAILLGMPRTSSLCEITKAIDQLAKIAYRQDKVALLSELGRIVPEFGKEPLHE